MTVLAWYTRRREDAARPTLIEHDMLTKFFRGIDGREKNNG